ncbi:sigma-70 family RNA polymerase sigma factor [Hyphomonas pacifica]|uniref:RNA polymerase sigma factor n=1 Tax=Hyphomonas pacifica TaxID=1280941 RepID=A0A062U0H3_9PROT|nr:RNA polymerase sigma factor RpoD/SigA [Hyphomonas pacifica]KCZ51228.1 hypothetical protein HY2_11780 [Hyphomonas pacifica]RAN33511.1 hypothetical protein HY3_12690 [Hyphomonas pacifica]
MTQPVDERGRMFERTLEDLQDDAVRKKGKLNRLDVDAIYLKRGISPEEAIALERALASEGVEIEDGGNDAAETIAETSSSDAAMAPTALDYLVRISRKNPLLSRDEEIECGDAIRQADQLAPEADDELSARVRKRSEEAKTKLVTRNVRLVVKVAFDKRYRGRMDADDLVQMGLIGLMKAADKFDPTWETRFSTYATWWVRQAMSRGLADQGTTVRVPVHMRQAISTYRRTLRMLVAENGKPPSTDTLAEKLAWTPEYTAKVATFSEQRTISLEAPIGADDDLTLKDVIADSAPQPEETVISEDMARRVRSLLDGLEDKRLADIVCRRFGFNGAEETLQEIGDDYGITRERIRQLEDKAIRKLKLRATKARLEASGS